MAIRVAHIVNPNFGLTYSGITHRLFSLLSGWKDVEISMDLYGVGIKPMNMNSGDLNYQLPPKKFWSSPKRLDRKGRIKWSFDLINLLIKQRNEYDIVHFHSLGWGGLLSPLFLHPLKKKVVFTMSLMGNDNPGYIFQQPRGRLQIKLLRLFDGAIGISQALVDDAENYRINHVINLPNFLAYPELIEEVDGIDKRTYRAKVRGDLGIPESAKVLFFVGSIIHRKGVDILVDVFRLLAKTYPDLFLILLGPKNSEESSRVNDNFVSKLQMQLTREGLGQRVFWIGIVKERTRIAEYYHAADVFVFPTRNEGLGNVLIEASAAELPVVASLLPGVTDEVIKDAVSGYLIEAEKPDKFAAAVESLLLNEEKRVAMGKAGRKIVLDKFGFEAYCKQLKKFYLDIYYGNN